MIGRGFFWPPLLVFELSGCDPPPPRAPRAMPLSELFLVGRRWMHTIGPGVYFPSQEDVWVGRKCAQRLLFPRVALKFEGMERESVSCSDGIMRLLLEKIHCSPEMLMSLGEAQMETLHGPSDGPSLGRSSMATVRPRIHGRLPPRLASDTCCPDDDLQRPWGPLNICLMRC